MRLKALLQTSTIGWFAGGALAMTLSCGGMARAETLADAVALAYRSNPGIQAQRAQLRALNESYVQARSNFGIRANVEVDASYDSLRTATGRTFDADSYSQSLNLTQPLFTGGRVSGAVQAAEADVRAARERLRQAEADLLQRVVTAYVGVRRDQQILAVARSTVTVLQQQLEETRAKTEVRENTRTDLAQAESRLAAAQVQGFNAESQLASSRAAYLNAVGQNPGVLAPEPDLPGLPASVDEAFNVAETQNMTLMAAKYAEQATRAVETYTSDRLLIDSTRRNVVQNLSQQWSQLSAARSALSVDQTYVSASETAFYGMRQEERLGLRSTIELLNTQQELTSAQIALLRDRFTEYTARVGVLSFIGRLTVDTLAPGVAVYDPVADFNRVKNKGALPTELVARALDSVVTPSMGPPKRATETATPDQQLPLGTAPPDAASTPPMKSVADLMAETRETSR